MTQQKTSTRTKVANEVVTFKKYTKLQTNKDFLKGSNYTLIKKGNLNEWNSIRNLSTLISKGFEYFKTKECKNELKKVGLEDLNVTEFYKDEFNYEKSALYEYKKIGEIEKDKFDNYIKENTTPNIKKICKHFSNKKETTKKEKTQYLKIAVTKDEKITFDGIASKNVYALIIEEMKRRMNEAPKVKAPKVKAPKNEAVSLAC
jgi:hypothetical protein